MPNIASQPKNTLRALLLACLIAAAGGRASGHGPQLASGLKEGKVFYQAFRLHVPLNSAWRFKRQAAPGPATEPEFVAAELPSYDDSSWTTVALPHTWDATPDNPFAVAGHFRGLGWYRRQFDVRREWQGRRVHVEFKGVFQVADVWVNGKHAGRHVGGFTGFTFDITDGVEWGAKNVLAVRVNDVLDPTIAPTNESNVSVYGGIYRSVSLVITSLLHFPYNAVRVTTEPAASSAPAAGDRPERVGVTVQVTTRLENPSDSPRRARLETLIVDAAGQPRATLTQEIALGAGITEITQTAPALMTPNLWSLDSPYLYRAVSTLYDGGRAADRIMTPFGIRFMGYDPATGFLLNGAPINLHGVNRRQDYGFLGDALPETVAVKDIRMIKEMGANFLRTSHYPQDPAILDACDQLGILVWEEIPNIKIYMYAPSSEDIESHYAERFPRALMENLKLQLKEMIERDRNHPSIIIWGLADDLSTYHYPQDFVELSQAAHALDASRWTAGRAPHVTDVTDATSEPNLVAQHREHPERMYIWNEWGAFPNERGREGKPAYDRAPIDPEADVSLADSDAALLLEGYLMQWNALPWLGTAKWCMFDPSSVNSIRTQPLYHRRDGQVSLRWPFNDYRGVADMWRLPKNGFYFLESQWTEKPMVHIVGHWTWSGESSSGLQVGKDTAAPKGGATVQAGTQKRTVRVYSNCGTVELILNGRSLGVHKPETNEQVWQDFQNNITQYKSPDQFNQQPLPGAMLVHPPFVWVDVPYEPGRLVAVCHKGNAAVQDELRTAGAPTAITLKADKQALAVEGEDVSFVEADVVDASGVVVPEARPWIRFSVEGPGRFLGGTTEVDAISGVAAINLQSTGEAGEIVVTATSPGLKSGSVRLSAR
jgi:beta-galactosidase